MNKWRFRSRIVMLFFLLLITVRGYCVLPIPANEPPAPRGGTVALHR